ncbi:probable G-protein coupled receptor 139 [Narcine bancroftii]|uniref:probable G-protein coupled receptor 139 n=1 Tax=Narcine bancroftii TaxID=1343680 RepID=UPI00383227A8
MPYPAIYYLASIYYPVLAAVGIPVNVAAIVILSRGKCGLSKGITRYLLGMAAADFLVVVIVITLKKINDLYLYARFLHLTRVCSLLVVFRYASMDCSVWFTVAFTYDRYIAICCQNLQKKYCNERVATVVLVIVAAVSCVRCIPFYFVVEPYVIIDNVPWRCAPIPEYYTEPLWRAIELFDSIFTPILPISLIILFNGLTGKHILVANRVRRGLRGNSENQKDSELENRRKSIILLFTISTNFILLWLPYVIHSMNWQRVNQNYTDQQLNTPIFIFQQCGMMLQFLSICTNTCIYGLTQRKFRDELKSGLKFLFTLNGLLCK